MMGRFVSKAALLILIVGTANGDSSSVRGATPNDTEEYDFLDVLDTLNLEETEGSASDLTCITTAFDVESCSGTKTSDGAQDCVWCSSGSFGLCVTPDQKDIMEDKLPEGVVDCSGGSFDIIENSPIVQDSVEDCPFLTCIKKKDNEECSEDSCNWCKTKAGFGVCLDDTSVIHIKDCPWFDCDATDPEVFDTVLKSSSDEEVSDIMDMSCFQESQDAESCPSSVDADGAACVWCSAAGFGLCLNTDQASQAQSYMTCGDDATSVEKKFTALMATESH